MRRFLIKILSHFADTNYKKMRKPAVNEKYLGSIWDFPSKTQTNLRWDPVGSH